jgi:uncharacterized protein YktB (UPF0637 family)
MMFKDIFSGPISISKMLHPVSFSFFQELKEKYEMIKVELQAKEVISKDNMQEFLVNPSMQFSHDTTFVHKFVVDMKKFKECNLSLDVNKEHILNSWGKNPLQQRGTLPIPQVQTGLWTCYHSKLFVWFSLKLKDHKRFQLRESIYSNQITLN